MGLRSTSFARLIHISRSCALRPLNDHGFFVLKSNNKKNMTTPDIDQTGHPVGARIHADHVESKANLPWWAIPAIGTAVAVPAGPIVGAAVVGGLISRYAVNSVELGWVDSIRSYFRRDKGDAAAAASKAKKAGAAQRDDTPAADYAELSARLKRVHEQMTLAAAEKLEISNCFNDLYALYGVGLGFGASRGEIFGQRLASISKNSYSGTPSPSFRKRIRIVCVRSRCRLSPRPSRLP